MFKIKIFVGEAGKTSLITAMTSANSHEAPVVTDGIIVKDWNIQLPDQTTLTFSTWDFGKNEYFQMKMLILNLLYFTIKAGQSVYYNTHQFFLTQRAIYILVW